MNKTLDEYFDDMKDLPKGPIRLRKKTPSAEAELKKPVSDAVEWLLGLAENGPDLAATAHVKAVHEAVELELNPSLEELADVALCLIGVAVHNGWSWEQVSAAMQDKVEVNKSRVWYQKLDGSWQHKELDTLTDES